MKRLASLYTFLSLISSSLFCQDTIKLMSYNLLNYDNIDSSRDAEFRIVISSVNPDILVVQEIISQGAVNQFLSNVMNSFGETYAAGTFIDGYDTDNAVFYKTSKFGFVVNIPIKTDVRDINEFIVEKLWSKDTLHIFSVHLKSSSGASFEAQRALEVDSLRKRTNAFPPGTDFIVCGDFNFYKSSEPAYQKLLQDNSTDEGNFFDPISMPGTWNNSTYAQYHTQSPRTRSFGGGVTGGMDDRFDLILHSPDINSGNNIKLVPGSYTVYGNDGNHFNDSVNRPPNNAVSQSIANALHKAADHLPVYVSMVFNNAILNTPYFAQSTMEEKAVLSCYPDPFSTILKIEYVIPENSFITLSIFDINGSKLANIVNEYKEKGCYQTEYIAPPQMRNGLYYYSLKSGNGIITKKILRLR